MSDFNNDAGYITAEDLQNILAFNCGDQITDNDGNEYETVLIGSQCWTKTNMRTSVGTDGTSTQVSSDTEPYYYTDAITPEANANVYGYYYNWTAAKMVCPSGWRLPTHADWINLDAYMQTASEYWCTAFNYESHYYALALAAPTGWNAYSSACAPGNAQVPHNATGFGAYPLGFHPSWDSQLYYNGEHACFWSSTIKEETSSATATNVYAAMLTYSNYHLNNIANFNSKDGLSVRCMRDVLDLGGEEQVQSDWNEQDQTSPAYIQHKPEIPQNLSDLEDDMGYITPDDLPQYLPEIPTNVGAFENDANYLTPDDLVDYIPEIPDQVQSDWAEQNQSDPAYILNKPEIPTLDDIQAMINSTVGPLNQRINDLEEELANAQAAAATQNDVAFKCGVSKLYDVDGNAYNTVKIGNYCWMKENLRATHYADGTAIIHGYGEDRCYQIPYLGSGPGLETKGLLYNLMGAMNGIPTEEDLYGGDTEEGEFYQGACPDGWHIPGLWNEFNALTSYVLENQLNCGNNTNFVAKALASDMADSWYIDSQNHTCAIGNDLSANNATGFSAVATGFGKTTVQNGVLVYSNYNLSAQTMFWTATPYWDNMQHLHTDSLPCPVMIYDAGYVNTEYAYGNDYYLSVRCVRDEAEGTLQQMQEQIESLQQQLEEQSGEKPYVSLSLGNISVDDTTGLLDVNLSASASSPGEILLAKGFCWSTSENPTVNNNYVLCNGNNFTYALKDLYWGTKYYVRAFATNANGTSYSSQQMVYEFSISSYQYAVPTSGSETVTLTDTSSIWVYDAGGPNHDYGTNWNGFLTIRPSDPSKKVKLITGTYALEGSSNWDYVEIYNGTVTTSSSNYVNKYYAQSGTPNAYTSTASDGSLTIRFRSDVSVVKPGFAFRFATVGACDGVSMVTDYDQNTYTTVEIGSQCWMRENICSTHYSDGTSIPLGGTGTSGSTVSNATVSATSRYYYRNTSLGNNGYYYNLDAANKSAAVASGKIQGVCPTGWHIPSKTEWETLVAYLQSDPLYSCNNNSTYVAKALATSYGWSSTHGYTCSPADNQSSNNSSGFSAYPAGRFNNTGNKFDLQNAATQFRCANDGSANFLFTINVDFSYTYLQDNSPYAVGASVRCIKN